MFARIVVGMYCFGLMACYTFLSFKSWDSLPSWAYYMWDKSFGGGFFVWLIIYINLWKIERKAIAPIVFFSGFRFIFEIVSFCTGITAYNEIRVAILFLILLCVFYVLSFSKGNFMDRFLSKYL